MADETLRRGDKVTCSAKKTYDGSSLASNVRKGTYDVLQVGGSGEPSDKVKIGVIGAPDLVVAAVKRSSLTKLKLNLATSIIPSLIIEKFQPINEYQEARVALLEYEQARKENEALSTERPVVKTLDGESVAKEATNKILTIDNIVPDVSPFETKYISDVNINAPSIIQNKYGFPTQIGQVQGKYRYDYEIDGASDELNKKISESKSLYNSSINIVHKSVNLPELGTTRRNVQVNYSEYYNKFKQEYGYDQLSKAFGHVFFIRPDCNIFTGSTKNGLLTSKLRQFPDFYYASKHNPELLKQLTQYNSEYNHEFGMLLSNKARSFEVSDESIDTDTYGKSITGYSVAYGKDNVESKAANKFSISYTDDRDLRIYHLHKLWTDYISYVFRGKVSPRDEYVINKVIDYASCVYYIVCAEDGETIIFWTKYWGVFPLDAPSSSFSFNQEDLIRLPNLKIQYQYSWKEDYNPLSLVEFNMHSDRSNLSYVRNYSENKLGPSAAWAGAPFIETTGSTTSLSLPYTYKLRFRKGLE